MVASIVDHPDQVKVTSVGDDGDTVNIVLNVAEEDMGMVIGKHGNIARSLRTVVKSAAKLIDKKVNVEIK